MKLSWFSFKFKISDSVNQTPGSASDLLINLFSTFSTGEAKTAKTPNESTIHEKVNFMMSYDTIKFLVWVSEVNFINGWLLSSYWDLLYHFLMCPIDLIDIIVFSTEMMKVKFTTPSILSCEFILNLCQSSNFPLKFQINKYWSKQPHNYYGKVLKRDPRIV